MRGWRRGASLLIALAVTTAVAGRARADGQAMQDAIAIELGLIGHVGQSEYAFHNGGSAPNVQGIVIRDRNGWTGRAVLSVLVMLVARVGMTGPRTMSYDDTSSRSDYADTCGHLSNPSGCSYTVTTTTTTTTFNLASKEELERGASAAVSGLFGMQYSDFELHLFSRNGLLGGDASGFKMNAFVGRGERTGVEIGFGLGEVTSYVEYEGAQARINYSYLAFPIRLSRVVGPLRWALTYEWNLLGYGGDTGFESMDEEGLPLAHNGSHPLKLDASGVVLGRLSVTGGVTAQRFYRPNELGAYGSVGFRF